MVEYMECINLKRHQTETLIISYGYSGMVGGKNSTPSGCVLRI